jgi:uncharacterized damage-inducible protein DinB
MKETQRISELFEDMYNGESWIGVSLLDTLQNIPAATAARKEAPWNSIWEIVNHVISWRENVIKRVQGNTVTSPENNYFEPVTDQSDAAWKKTLAALKESQDKWTEFLRQMDDGDLDIHYPGNNASYYKNIHGIVQHDAYHLGQIVLLAKKV